VIDSGLTVVPTGLLQAIKAGLLISPVDGAQRMWGACACVCLCVCDVCFGCDMCDMCDMCDVCDVCV
jgi:hypothetical protein